MVFSGVGVANFLFPIAATMTGRRPVASCLVPGAAPPGPPSKTLGLVQPLGPVKDFRLLRKIL